MDLKSRIRLALNELDAVAKEHIYLMLVACISDCVTEVANNFLE